MSMIDYAVLIAALTFSTLGSLAGLFLGFVIFSQRSTELNTYENVDENHR